MDAEDNYGRLHLLTSRSSNRTSYPKPTLQLYGFTPWDIIYLSNVQIGGGLKPSISGMSTDLIVRVFGEASSSSSLLTPADPFCTFV